MFDDRHKEHVADNHLQPTFPLYTTPKTYKKNLAKNILPPPSPLVKSASFQIPQLVGGKLIVLTAGPWQHLSQHWFPGPVAPLDTVLWGLSDVFWVFRYKPVSQPSLQLPRLRPWISQAVCLLAHVNCSWAGDGILPTKISCVEKWIFNVKLEIIAETSFVL